MSVHLNRNAEFLKHETVRSVFYEMTPLGARMQRNSAHIPCRTCKKDATGNKTDDRDGESLRLIKRGNDAANLGSRPASKSLQIQKTLEPNNPCACIDREKDRKTTHLEDVEIGEQFLRLENSEKSRVIGNQYD